jgi:hypothetical protein
MKSNDTWKNGDMKVLSTTKMICFSLAIFATAAISHNFKVGLVGVSTHMS